MNTLTNTENQLNCQAFWFQPFRPIRSPKVPTFFMLNSTECEICPAKKSQITNNSFLLSIVKHENFALQKLLIFEAKISMYLKIP